MEFRKFKLVAGFAAVLAVLSCAAAQAIPLFTFWAEYNGIGYTDDTFGTAYGYDLLANPEMSDSDDIHEFSLYVTTTGAAASPNEEALALALLDINLTGGFAAATSGGAGLYAGDASQVNPNGAAAPALGPVWANNEDAGGDTTDLDRIVIIANANAAYAYTADVGKAGPYALGVFYLTYDHTGPPYSPDGSTVSVSTDVPDDSMSYYRGGNSNTGVGAAQLLCTDAQCFAAGPEVFIEGPEGLPPNTPPVAEDDTSIYLLYGQTVVNHTFAATDAEDGNTAPPLVWSEVSRGGPDDVSGMSMDAQGNFSWNTTGLMAGMYTFTAKVTDTGGLMDETTLTICVPEPATMALFGLAMVGLMGFIRRR